MNILVIAISTSLVLSGLMVLSILARTGLRGRAVLVPIGVILGALAGLLEQYWTIEDNVLIGQIAWLPAQFLAIAGVRSMLYGFVVGSAIVLTLARVGQTNRRADVMSIGIAVGLGFGLATTWIGLDQGIGWPPGRLIVATVNLPMQICFGVLVASAVMASRFASGGHAGVVTSYLLALTVQLAFQAVLITNSTIGHWLAWLEPLTLGLIWIGLICLLWLVGIAVMNAQQRADLTGEQLDMLRQAKGRLVLSPVTWTVIGSLVFLATAGLILVAINADLDSSLGRVMVYTVLAAPLLAAALIFRTAYALRGKPLSNG